MKALEFTPGARVELGEGSGNPGRKAFVLFPSNVTDELLVRFDGFAYNSLVPANRFVLLDDEPFRPYNYMTGRDECNSCRGKTVVLCA